MIFFVRSKFNSFLVCCFILLTGCSDQQFLENGLRSSVLGGEEKSDTPEFDLESLKENRDQNGKVTDVPGLSYNTSEDGSQPVVTQKDIDERPGEPVFEYESPDGVESEFSEPMMITGSFLHVPCAILSYEKSPPAIGSLKNVNGPVTFCIRLTRNHQQIYVETPELQVNPRSVSAQNPATQAQQDSGADQTGAVSQEKKEVIEQIISSSEKSQTEMPAQTVAPSTQNIIVGSNQSEELTGTDLEDTIVGRMGGDELSGGAGDDHLYPDGFNFSPADIDGLELWLDATDASTWFASDNCSGPGVAPGDKIGCWMDKSGNGYHFSQSASGERPSVKPSWDPAGRSSLEFRGTATALRSKNVGALKDVNGYTILMVTKYDRPGNFLLLEARPASDPGKVGLILRTDGAEKLLYHHKHPFGIDFSGSDQYNSLGGSFIAGQWTTIMTHRTEELHSTRTNGRAAGNDLLNPDNTAFSDNFDMILGGADHSGTGGISGLTGGISSFIMYNRDLSDTDKIRIENYLACLHNIPNGQLNRSSDLLTGGPGADRFIWNTNSWSATANSERDVIKDFSFSEGDRVVFRFPESLRIIGEQVFSGDGSTGEVHSYRENNDRIIAVDFGGDGNTDMEVLLLNHGSTPFDPSWIEFW